MNMFSKNNYQVIRNLIDENQASLLYDYLSNKYTLRKVLLEEKLIEPKNDFFGWIGDHQVPISYCTYGDLLFDTLMVRFKDKLEKITKQKLLPQNSYARIYGTGASLKKHKDRPNCKLSVTLNLGGDPYPIYFLIKRKEVKVNLKPGDGIVYKGDKLIHWREKFKGSLCGQVFLHYNYSKEKIIYDGRRFIGMLKNKMIK
mgnify:CR=1 FL=1